MSTSKKKAIKITGKEIQKAYSVLEKLSIVVTLISSTNTETQPEFSDQCDYDRNLIEKGMDGMEQAVAIMNTELFYTENP